MNMPNSPQSAVPQPTDWEYHSEPGFPGERGDRNITKMAAQGWELTSRVPVSKKLEQVSFRRIRQEPAPIPPHMQLGAAMAKVPYGASKPTHHLRNGLVFIGSVVVVVIGLVAVLSVSNNGISASNNSISTPAAADTPGPAAKAAVGTTVTFTVTSFDGSAAATGTAVVNSATRHATGNVQYALNAPASGAGYLVLDVSVASTGGQVSVNPLYWTLQDAKGYTYQPALGAYNPQLDAVDVPAGSSRRGVVAFDVPVGSYTAQFSPVTSDVADWAVTG